MSKPKHLIRGMTAGLLVMAATSSSFAAESGFSNYPLGSLAFGGGVTPPPGVYVSAVFGYYQGDIGGNITLGGVAFDAGASVGFFIAGLNGLYVPSTKILGGNLGLSLTVPVGAVDLEAHVSAAGATVSRSTDGGGFADMNGKIQLGWQHGTFFHTAYIQGVAPTGRYATGFNPNVGLNRPAIDVGWGYTWIEASTKLQFNGTAGFMFNAENDATNYKTGNEFHYEWAIGRECSPGLMIGVVGYSYRQLTGDSGAGARLGPFKGTVDAIGPGISYTTLVRSNPLILTARYYHEFNVENRFEGSMSYATATLKF